MACRKMVLPASTVRAFSLVVAPTAPEKVTLPLTALAVRLCPPTVLPFTAPLNRMLPAVLDVATTSAVSLTSLP